VPARSTQIDRSIALTKQCVDACIDAQHTCIVAADSRVTARYQRSLAQRILRAIRKNSPPLASPP